jgi:plasminogen activator inhibitor 1 RNA-binding protein
MNSGGSDKQAAQSWGATEGNAELKDEQAGEDIAQTEKVADDAEPAEPAEPEDKSISYSDYLAQQAEKKLALEGGLNVRKANEGSKVDKKWAAAKELVKEDDEDFISGSGGKNKRERERKAKQLVEIDNRYVEPERPRGGRGGSRGGRGDARGAPRGGAPRGGAPRGGAPRGGARGEFRGGRGGRGDGPGLNTNDQAAFPSLGS